MTDRRLPCIVPELTRRRSNPVASMMTHRSQAEGQDIAVDDSEQEEQRAVATDKALAPPQQVPVLARHRDAATSRQMQLNLEAVSALPEQSQANHVSDDPIEDSIDQQAHPLLRQIQKSRKVCVHQPTFILHNQHVFRQHTTWLIFPTVQSGKHFGHTSGKILNMLTSLLMILQQCSRLTCR